MLPRLMHRILRWYDQYDDINTVIAAFLFSIQLIHLVWLTLRVVLPSLFGFSVGHSFFDLLVAIVDYTEIPAILSTSLVYLKSYARKPNKKDFIYLLFLNIQWLHIFWITDEIVVESIGYQGVASWNPIFAWFAIAIDYLELPVIFETIGRALRIIR